jgi:glycine cleavage system T protein (aminomethyltransferase)
VARFAHNSERQFAKLLDFYNIAWEYEPRTFTLERDRDGRPAQAFTPDFYLPVYDLYIEITTLNQKLVTKKNKKARRLREQYPEVEIRVLYQRDYLHLLVKYGLEPPSQLVDAGVAGEEPLPLPLARRAARSSRRRGRERVSEPGQAQPALRCSPLDAQHVALGARMVPFGGWAMPLQYTGVLEEHRACRERAVVFDVSHLGTVEFAGAGARDALQWLLTNDLGRIGPGRAQYTHLLDPGDAHVVDDIIVWWVAPERFFVMPNASNTERLSGAAVEAAPHVPDGFDVSDVTDSRAVLAVQGPDARKLLSAVSADAAAVPRFDVVSVGEWTVAGTGYTGEDGVEIHVPAADASELWNALVGAGITPAGLGARDTLRLEAGLPLHGHELGPGITPLQAGLGWVVRWDKGDFRGREPLTAERERGVTRRLRGISIEGRRPAREGAAVLIEGREAGTVTSGNFSPTLGHAIALAFVPPVVEIGAAVQCDVRGQLLDGRVVKLPFVEH